jgi:hypothetical protein
MRFGRKVDSNQADIVKDLRVWGGDDISIEDTHDVGGGFPDLVVGWRGVTLLVEVKSPGARVTGKVKRETDDRQRGFREKWRGTPVCVATTAEDVITALSNRLR